MPALSTCLYFWVNKLQSSSWPAGGMSIATELESSSLLDEDCCDVVPDEFAAVVVGGVLTPTAAADVVVVVGLFVTGVVELPGEVLSAV